MLNFFQVSIRQKGTKKQKQHCISYLMVIKQSYQELEYFLLKKRFHISCQQFCGLSFTQLTPNPVDSNGTDTHIPQ